MKRISLDRFLNSFRFAFDGVKTLLKEEENYLIHTIAALVVIILGLIYRLSSTEWVSIFVAIGFVMITETLNTSIENIMDYISTEKKPAIKRIKDLSAAAVLISAVIASSIGLLVFLPKII